MTSSKLMANYPGGRYMKEQKLVRLLSELQEEIERLRSENEEQARTLEDLERHVGQSLGQLREPDGELLDHESLRERMAEAVESFEEEHPKLTSILSDILGALSNYRV